MDTTPHEMASLFRQLGLPDGESDIRGFIARHRPLPGGMALADAPFWSESQARFLREEWREDADWAPVVDQLNLALSE